MNINNFNYRDIKKNTITNKSNKRRINTIKLQVSLSSEFRKKVFIGIGNNVTEQSSSTDFIIELPDLLTNITSMELLSSEIPLLEYNFSSIKNNNKFKIKIKDTGTNEEETYNICIPYGLWYAIRLTKFMETNYMNYLGDEIYPDFNNNNTIYDSTGRDVLLNQNKLLKYLIFEVSILTGKTILRYKTLGEIDAFNTNVRLDYQIDVLKIHNNQISFSIENDNDIIYNERNFKNSCLGTMGYLYSDIYDVYNNNNLKTIVGSDSNYKESYGYNQYKALLRSSKVFGSGSDSGFYISVNDFNGDQSQQILTLGEDAWTTNNVLSRVQISSTVFQSNVSNSKSSSSIKRIYYNEVKIQKLHIKVLNKYGNVINLNNYPTNFVFEFTKNVNSFNR